VVAQEPPKISEVFESKVSYEVVEAGRAAPYKGEGTWAANQQKGHGLQIAEYEEHNIHEVYRLKRYDLNASYEVDSWNKTICNIHELDGSAPSEWGWLSQATYKGKAEYKGKPVYLWEFIQGYATLELAVDANSPNTPVVLRRMSDRSNYTVYFETFSTTPSDHVFDIPHTCQARAAAPSVGAPTACRSRDDMIAVANKWVNNKVPYNQGATYEGYREDCSGYVSACWDLAKPGHTTQTLVGVSKQITKAQLTKGDVLLYAAEHVVLFDGWTDSGKTHYTAYEETKPGEGTVKRTTPYPYWYSQSDFIPHRYNSVC